jgi:hypothetical protein
MDAMFKNGFQRTAVPRAGHFLHPKQPKTVADHLLGFLNSRFTPTRQRTH